MLKCRIDPVLPNERMSPMGSETSGSPHETRKAVVERVRSLAALRDARARVTWVTAPAGAGKSHLLEQIAAHSEGRVLNLQVEPGDVDPGRFFERLAGASRTLAASNDAPRFGSDDVDRLRDFAVQLLTRLGDERTGSTLLLLDDVHHLDEAPDLLEALAYGVERAPARLSLTIASRTAAPASWTRFRASGTLACLGGDSLAMDLPEIRALLLAHEDWPHGRDETLVGDLLEATRGWASGLGLLIELGKRRPTSFGALEARDIVRESFAEQILGAFPDAERETLMLLSPCERLYPEMLRDIFGPEALRLLERLRRRNVLVTRDYATTDDEAPYRLHALLRDCLRERAREEIGRRRLARSCRRLADALLDRGDEAQARDLWLFARDWAPLARHLEAVAATLHANGQGRSLARWLACLPAKVRARSTTLRFWHGVCLLAEDPAASRRELVVAYDGLRSEDDPGATVRAWSTLVDTIWFEWDDCTLLDRYIDDMPTIAALVARDGEPTLRAMLVKGAFAALSFRAPGRADFAAWEEDNLELFQGRLPRAERITRGLQLMIHYVYGSGERAKADLVRMRLRQIYDAEAESAADHCAYWVVSTAYAFWFSPDPDQAPALATTGLAVTERLGAHHWDVPLLNAALFRAAADESVDSLVNLLDRLDASLGPHSRRNDLAIGQHFIAYRAWLEDRPRAALTAIETALRMSEESGFIISPLYYGLGRTAVLDTLERNREALRELGRWRRRARDQRSRCMLFVACMIGAGVALRRGSASRAGRYLSQAFAIGEVEGYRTVLWLRLETRGELCRLAARAGIARDYARTLGADFKLARALADAPRGLQLRTLGRADIRRGGASLLTTQKPPVMPLLLLLHLVAAGESGAANDTLIDALWPDAAPRSGRDRLKSTLYRLRALCAEPAAIVSAGGRTRLDGGHVSVDAWTLLSLANSVEDSARRDEALASAVRALELHEGRFVDLYSGHVDLLIFRRRLTRSLESLVRRAASVLIAEGERERAIELLETALERAGENDALAEELQACRGRSS